MVSHSTSQKHRKKRTLLKENQSLPSALSAAKKAVEGDTASNKNVSAASDGRPCSVPYGAAENIHNSQFCTQGPKSQSKPSVSFLDKKSHAEARTLSFIAEHSLPLSLVQHLIKYAQEMAQDSKVLTTLNMERTTAAYKLRDGLGAVLHRRLVNELRISKFSINVDECMSAAHEKVFSVIVSYFSEEEKCTVFKHYMSVSMAVVNAETLYNCIMNKLKEDDISHANLISILSDSANYMRGKTSGIEIRLRSAASHMLDIDGGVCHHVHNIVKSFCNNFGDHVEKLADDLFTDFKWSPDLVEVLKELCILLGKTCQVPKLSVFDVTVPNLNMLAVLTVFYWAWLPASDQYLYNDILESIMGSASQEAQHSIRELHKKLKDKRLTDDGKNRKKRVVEKLFYLRTKTILLMGLYIDLLPLFKSFILMFEQKEPMMHRLHDEQVSLVRNFLACFIKPEYLSTLSSKEMLKLDVTMHAFT